MYSSSADNLSNRRRRSQSHRDRLHIMCNLRAGALLRDVHTTAEKVLRPTEVLRHEIPAAAHQSSESVVLSVNAVWGHRMPVAAAL